MSRNSKRKRDQKRKKAASQKFKAVPELASLRANRKRYITEWGVTSSHFLNEGHYGWMSDKVDKYVRVLEIGCGVGYSTLELLQDGHKVVSIDENQACVAAFTNPVWEFIAVTRKTYFF